VSPEKTAESIQMPFGLRTLMCLGNYVLDGGSRSPMGRGRFAGGNGRPSVKYKDALRSSVQKRLNRSRCRLGYGLGWVQGIVLDGGPEVLRDVAMASTFWLLIDYNFGL